MFSVEGLAQEPASNEGEKAEVAPPVVTDTRAKQAREALNDMGYGVYASDKDNASEPGEKLSVKAERIADDAAQLVVQVNQQAPYRALKRSCSQSVNRYRTGQPCAVEACLQNR